MCNNKLHISQEWSMNVSKRESNALPKWSLLLVVLTLTAFAMANGGPPKNSPPAHSAPAAHAAAAQHSAPAQHSGAGAPNRGAGGAGNRTGQAGTGNRGPGGAGAGNRTGQTGTANRG